MNFILLLLSFSNLFCLEDFYKILGVPRNADKKTIKKAFSELSKKYHPDKTNNKEDVSHYTQIVNAYETLKDPQQKEEYDQKLLYGENDYSDVLFNRNRNFQYRPRYSDEYGDFYGYNSYSQSKFYRRNEPINLGEVINDFFKEKLFAIYKILFEIGPYVLETIYVGFNVIIIVTLFLMNCFIGDVHYFLRK